jgi:hypothetical protein
MEIKLKEITIKQLASGYKDNAEDGVIGYGGKLDIRPPYQREFIYKDKQRDAVINTISKEFPLNVMYWAVREDGTYEVIDGQQRTISICQYVSGDFSVVFGNIPEFRAFHNLTKDEKEEIEKYKLMIYLCSGTDSEKLEWFRTINIAGEKLTEQELRNAVYSGSWVTDAKRYFSKNGCVAYQIGKDYLNGAPNRQEYLETAIKWASKGNIEVYMSNRQHDPTAVELWNYFQTVINWVQATFTVKRKFMKVVEWGPLFDKYNTIKLDPKKIEEETAKLIADDDVEKKSGIYPYILTRDEKYLSIRAFTDSQKQKVYEKQKGICPHCKKEKKEKIEWSIAEMEGDHITPWKDGGRTVEENCQMLCKDHNRRKSGI